MGSRKLIKLLNPATRPLLLFKFFAHSGHSGIHASLFHFSHSKIIVRVCIFSLSVKFYLTENFQNGKKKKEKQRKRELITDSHDLLMIFSFLFSRFVGTLLCISGHNCSKCPYGYFRYSRNLTDCYGGTAYYSYFSRKSRVKYIIIGMHLHFCPVSCIHSNV